MPWLARTIVQRHGALRASRPQLKRDPLGGDYDIPWDGRAGSCSAGFPPRHHALALHNTGTRSEMKKRRPKLAPTVPGIFIQTVARVRSLGPDPRDYPYSVPAIRHRCFEPQFGKMANGGHEIIRIPCPPFAILPN